MSPPTCSTLQRGARADVRAPGARERGRDLAADPELQEFARAAGESVFGDYCRTCHGAGGAGAPGYPVLADDVWIWGGSLADIEHTLRVGVRSDHPETRMSMMPAFGRDALLDAATDRRCYRICDLALGRARAAAARHAAAAARGALVYQEQCALCHGAERRGRPRRRRAQPAATMSGSMAARARKFAARSNWAAAA